MEHILSPLGHGFVFGAGRILFAGRTRTGRRHSKMGFYVIVPRKARHDSTGNPISSFKPVTASLGHGFVFGAGGFCLQAGRGQGALDGKQANRCARFWCA